MSNLFVSYLNVLNIFNKLNLKCYLPPSESGSSLILRRGAKSDVSSMSVALDNERCFSISSEPWRSNTTNATIHNQMENYLLVPSSKIHAIF